MKKYFCIIIILFIFFLITLYPKTKINSFLEINFKPIPTIQENTISITTRNKNDRKPEIGETIATIRIEDLGIYAPITYGASQQQVDINDVCLTESNQFDNPYAILAGHAYKTFSILDNIEVNNTIQIHSYYGNFDYIVTAKHYGYTDNYNIYDSSNNALLNLYPNNNTLYIYSCFKGAKNNRLLIIAEEKN